MPFTIVRQDITKMNVDAVVNAANTELLMGGGVCGAIFKAAGAKELQEACNKKSPIKTGEAVITPAFKLPAKYVIHAAGPVYSHNDREKSAELLASAYMNSLRMAVENKCESIAFPLISSGIYGYPKDEALQVATAAITEFIGENDIDVYLAVFDKTAFQVSEQLMGEVASYIDEHYIDTHDFRHRKLLDVEKDSILEANAPVFATVPDVLESEESLEDLVDNLDEPFSDTLLQLIDAKMSRSIRKRILTASYSQRYAPSRDILPRSRLFWHLPLRWSFPLTKQTICWNERDMPSLTQANLMSLWSIS